MDKDIIQKFLKHTNDFLKDNDNSSNINTINRSLALLKNKKQKVLDLMLDNVIDTVTYNEKINDIEKQIEARELELKRVENSIIAKKNLQIKLADIRNKVLECNDVVTFDSEVFNELIDRVIIGDNENGIFNPFIYTYVFNIGDKNNDSNIVCITEEEVPYEFWSFDTTNNGNKVRRVHNTFKIKVSISK